MQCYTEVVPPTAVTHAVSLPFLHAKARNLVVAKTSLLQIFSTKFVAALTSERELGAEAASTEPEQFEKLVLIGEYPISGTVTSLARISTLNTKSGGDALLVSVKDAKISLLEWDPEIHGLSTISIHYYEGEEIQGSPWAPELRDCHSFLTVDPSSRCAALKFGIRHLAVVPFRQHGDELVGDYDPDLDELEKKPSANGIASSTEHEKTETPYLSSFVLPLTMLDPNLIHPVDLAFLYEYREPTLAVIGSSRAASSSLLHERKDILSYTVFTLDLEQRARTQLLSVTGLPSDLFKLMPLPLPVGGALLIGCNEILHIDQSGKSNAVAVNEYAKKVSNFAMADQSDLSLRLEGCSVEQVDSRNGDMLIMTMDGDLVIVNFKIDGRSMTGLSLRRINASTTERFAFHTASCSASVRPGSIFLGLEDGDSILMRCRRPLHAQLTRKRSHADMLNTHETDSDEDVDVDDDDDLYANTAEAAQSSTPALSRQTSSADYQITIQDRLLNLAPTGKPAFVKRSINNSSSAADAGGEALQLAIPTGHRESGRISFLNEHVHLHSVDTLNVPQSQGAWSVKSRVRFSSGQMTTGNDSFDNVLIVSNTINGRESSSAYSILSDRLEERKGTEFESDVGTLDVGVSHSGAWIIQVKKEEVRSYDADFVLGGIAPISDDDQDTESHIIHASIADEYILAIRDDLSIAVLKVEQNGDLEPLDLGDVITSAKWTSGSIYCSQSPTSPSLLYLLSIDGALLIFSLPHLKEPVYTADSLRFIPPRVTSGPVTRRSPARDHIVEILVADLGDSTQRSPYLMARTEDDVLIIYEPYHLSDNSSKSSFTSNLRWLKALTVNKPFDAEDDDESSSSEPTKPGLRAINNVNGYSAVVWQGKSPALIVRDSQSVPRMLPISGGPLPCLGSIHMPSCSRGLVSVNNNGQVSLSQLPPNADLGSTGWVVSQLHLGQEVTNICYHEHASLYVVGTTQREDFSLPSDDFHKEWEKEDTSFAPHVARGQLKLIQPRSGVIIDKINLDEFESIVSLQVLDLEISEKTHERKPLIAVGTFLNRGEDLPANGCIYLYEVISVVPWPDRPETNLRFKLIVKEEVKGAVTAISSIGDQGFGLVVQGQKCLVRGMKEDVGMLPIAFMDMQCYVNDVKNLKGTGLALMADPLRGVWFFGFSEDPYRLTLLGKTGPQLQAVVTEFLPHDDQLFIFVADADCNLQVFEYNPEDPESEYGMRLLRKSVFHTGQFPHSMTLIPSTTPSLQQQQKSQPSLSKGVVNGSEDTDLPNAADSADEDAHTPPISLQHILLSAQSGSLALLTPLDEQTYRRLAVLQTHLISILDHVGGLNPRAYRAVESEGFGGRGVLDGTLLRRWNTLSSQRRLEACTRVGAEAWQVRADLDILGGGGLGYL